MARHSVKEDIVEAASQSPPPARVQRDWRAGHNRRCRRSKGLLLQSFREQAEALGVVVLDRYWEGALNSLEVLKDESVAPAVRLKSYFRRLNQLARKLKYRPGCMVGNFSIEMSDQSPVMRERLATILAKWSREIETCVKKAQADGSVRRDPSMPKQSERFC